MQLLPNPIFRYVYKDLLALMDIDDHALATSIIAYEVIMDKNFMIELSNANKRQ